MISKFILPIIIFIPAAVIQLTLVPLISIESIAPDLVLIILVYFTLINGQLYGTILGFVLGLFFDLMSGGLLGSAMFSKTLAGFIVGYFFNEANTEEYTKTFKFTYIVLLAGAIDSTIYSMLALSESNTNIWKALFEQGILPALYTALVSLTLLLIRPVKN